MTEKALPHAHAALVTDDLMTARLEHDDRVRLHAHHALARLRRAENTTSGMNGA